MKNNPSEITKEWIKKADDDLKFAEVGFEQRFYNQVCMLCQQAVEKYLKAYLVHKKGELKKKEKIHDLPKLADLCKSLGLDLSDYYVQLRTLSEFYIPVRYPDAAFGVFGKDDAKESLESAKKIIEKVRESFGLGK